MRLKLSFISFCFTIFFLGCTGNMEKVEKQKPNIVLIFADDMTYSAIGALGNSEIHTPNLDHLVQEGTTFTNAYNMGGWNGAVCLASRAMMISGRYLWRAQAFSQNWSNKESGAYQKSWGKLMEGAGYDTYMTGKWHVAAPADTIFQVAKHIRPGMPRDAWKHNEMVRQFKEVVGNKIDGKIVTPADIMPIGYNRPLNETDTTWSPTDPKFGGFWEGGKHWSEVLKDDALGYIETAKNKDNPFFMYLAFNAPHDPRQAPQEYLDQYDLDKITLPKSFIPEYPNKEKIGCGQDLRDEALAPFPRTEYATKVHIKEYYAIISHLDAQVGEIIAALEETNQMDNTYIFFTADHGLAAGRHGLLGKQNMYDHSVRPPFMVTGPTIPKNQKVSAAIYLQDVMATSLELAGIGKPDYVEFNSILPLATGQQKIGNHKAIYGTYVDFQRMIRKDGYKLIAYPKLQKLLLFDLENDPEEINDLSNLPTQQERVKMLFNDLVQLQKEMGDELDLKSYFKKMDI